MSISLNHLFNDTLNPDANIRAKTELKLKELCAQSGFLDAALQSLAHDKSPNIQHAAAIYLKNNISRRWNPEPGEPILLEDEKGRFRSSLMNVLVKANKPIQRQLLSILGVILTADFPQTWPQFLPEIQRMINAKAHPDLQKSALACLLELINTYQWRLRSKRQDLEHVISQCGTLLLVLGKDVVNGEDDSSLELLRLILKCYRGCIMMELSPTFQQTDSILEWIGFLLTVVGKPVPEQVTQQDPQEQQNHLIWKCKKWAYHSLNRLFTRYGEPTQMMGEWAQAYKPFATKFVSEIAPQILNVYMNVLDLWIKKKMFITDKCLYFLGSFIEECVRPKTMWAYVKPHFQTLISAFCFPLMCPSEEDLHMFEDDPQAYIHQNIDLYGELIPLEAAASNLLLALALKRTKTTFNFILQFINTVVIGYEQSGNQYYQDFKAKDGALRMLGCLSKVIGSKSSKNPEMKAAMEQFMKLRILPELKSNSAILRARACDMLNKFAEIQFDDHNMLLEAYRGVISCLNDSSLVVRVQTALALQYLLKNETIKSSMSKDAQYIVLNLIKLANEVDADSLGNVIEELVQTFPEDIAPFAVDMVKSLSELFFKLMNEVTELGADDNGSNAAYDKNIYALGVLNTIETTILNIDSSPEVMKQIEARVLELVNWILGHKFSVFYHDCFEIVDSLSFSAKAISDRMWETFNAIITILQSEEGPENLEDSLIALLNFIYYGRQALAQNQSRCQSIVNIISMGFNDQEISTSSHICSARLSEAMMLSLRGYCDSVVPDFVNKALEALFTTKESLSLTYKIYMLEIIVNAIYYNAQLALKVLLASGRMLEFFTLWFSTLETMPRVHDKKLSMAGILSLLHIGKQNAPQELQMNWPQLFQGLLTVLRTYPAALKQREDAQSRDTGDGDSYFNNEYSNIGDDEDDEDDDLDDSQFESEVDQFLKQEQTSRSHDEGSGDVNFSHTTLYDPAEDFDEELYEDLCFETPLDDFDPYSSLNRYVQELQLIQPALLQETSQSLSKEQIETLNEAMAEGHSNNAQNNVQQTANA